MEVYQVFFLLKEASIYQIHLGLQLKTKIAISKQFSTQSDTLKSVDASAVMVIQASF